MSQPGLIDYYGWGLGIGIGDWDLGLTIGDWELRLGIGIGDWGL